MRLRDKQGVLLVAMVMLLVFASITVAGVSVFVLSRLDQTKVHISQTMAVNLAEAGIHQALYDFRFRDLSANGYFTFGQTNVTSQKFFVIGISNAADLVMVNTSAAAMSSVGSTRSLTGLTMQNATNSQSITIDRMIVTWTRNANLQQITINSSVVWSGDSGSPVDADITNVTLDTTPSTVAINSLQFLGNNMSSSRVSIQFVMTDGSIRNVDVYPASDQFNFWVNATGKTTLSNIWKTVRANYNALTSTVEDYLEINTQITP